MQRRQFLSSLSIIAGASLVKGCASFKSSRSKDGLTLLPTNGELIVRRELLTHNRGIKLNANGKNIGLYQLSDDEFSAREMRCSHQGCGIELDDNGYICPCHGATFDRYGQAIKGPATEPLKPAELRTDSEYIYVKML